MTTTKTFKTCRCCGMKHGLRQRVCRQCKVKAVWDIATDEQQAQHDAQSAKMEAMLRELMAAA